MTRDTSPSRNSETRRPTEGQETRDRSPSPRPHLEFHLTSEAQNVQPTNLRIAGPQALNSLMGGLGVFGTGGSPSRVGDSASAPLPDQHISHNTSPASERALGRGLPLAQLSEMSPDEREAWQATLDEAERNRIPNIDRSDAEKTLKDWVSEFSTEKLMQITEELPIGSKSQKTVDSSLIWDAVAHFSGQDTRYHDLTGTAAYEDALEWFKEQFVSWKKEKGITYRAAELPGERQGQNEVLREGNIHRFINSTIYAASNGMKLEEHDLEIYNEFRDRPPTRDELAIAQEYLRPHV